MNGRAFRTTACYRVADGNDPQTVAFVPAADLWKWEGATLNDPEGDGKVCLIAALRRSHSKDGREIVALVVENEYKQRRPILIETTGGMFFEFN
jgi:hypothetical protein